MKLIKSILFIIFFGVIFCSLPSFAQDYAYDGTVIYLSDNGNDSNDGKTAENAVKTLQKAASLAGKDGTVVVTDVYTNNGTDIPACTVAGQSKSSVFVNSSWQMPLSGDFTIKNIILRTTANWAFILAKGHTLTVEENVVSEKAGAATVYLSIRGGGNGQNLVGNSEIIIKSGTWQSVYGGTGSANVTGNTCVTVYGGASISILSIGNDGKAGTTVSGNGTVRLMGNSVQIGTFAKTDAIQGGKYLDITNYEGVVPENLIAAGLTVITDGKIPEAAEVIKPEFNLTGTEPDLSRARSVVYLSDYGNNENDGLSAETPVKTLTKAVEIGGKKATVVITDKYSHGSVAVPACTIVGIKSDAVLELTSWAMNISGSVTIKNLTLKSLVDWSFILANGNTFVAGENLTVKKGDGVKVPLSIRGGANSNIKGDTNITVKSGEWNTIFAGTAGAGVVSGNAYVTVYENAIVKNVSFGNDSLKEGGGIAGDSTLRLVGSFPGMSGISKPAGVSGKIYIDLADYDGTVDESWKELGAEIIESTEQRPAHIAETFFENNAVYDLSGIQSLVYVSDRGDDNNDGKTEKTPKKTLNAAYSALGENGGTVAVVGTYTHKSADTPKASVNITSTCSEDTFIWEGYVLSTNNTRIYNLNILLSRDWAFIQHYGTPLTIGEGVRIELDDGITVLPGIRAGGKEDFALTDITVMSGSFGTVYAGTGGGNLLGDARITVSGGKVSGISCGNDGSSGKILGNIIITVSDSAKVGRISDKPGQYSGYVKINVKNPEVNMPEVSSNLKITTDASDRIIPINPHAVYINGYPDGTFLPDKVMTRAEAISALSKLAGLTDNTEVQENTAFTDVADSDWYARSVKHLEALGALSFYGTSLSPSQGMTRGEFVKLIYGSAKAEAEEAVFSDVNNTHPYFGEIIRASKDGLVNGYPDGTFRPENTLTRAEIVTILNRLASRNAVSANTLKSSRFSDITGHWAFSQIICAASNATEDGVLLWYSGEETYSQNSPVDVSTLSDALTTAVLEGVDTADSDAVLASVEAAAVKKREQVRNTATDVKVSGTTYYVSADGDDSNDGKSPEKPWKTISKVNEAAFSAGDGVFFRRGDIFRGRIKTQAGVTYSAYGEGDKPRIYGSKKNYAGSDYWKATDKENVYVSSEAFEKDVGLIVFNEGEAYTFKHVLKLFDFDGELKADLEMYHNVDDKKVYLYSVSDPNTRFWSCEIAEAGHLISGKGDNVTIDNLCLRYTGSHGIGYSGMTDGLTVQNCEIGWIGGMLTPYVTNYGYRYGNGIEVYVESKNVTVTNCHIHQCYDAGITHQYFQTRPEYVAMENLKYKDNLIEYCVYNIEYVNAQPEDKGIMKNIEISSNLLIHGGEGWGYQRPGRGDTVLNGWNKTNYSESFLIYDNVLSTAEPKCALVRLGVGRIVSMPVLKNNLFIAKPGTNFGLYGLATNTWEKYDEKLSDRTVGLDGNTMVFMK